MYTLRELANRTGMDLRGDPDRKIYRIQVLEKATEGDVSFLYRPKYQKFLRITGASAVILGPAFLDLCPTAALVTRDPYLGYARVAQLLNSGRDFKHHIDSTASLGANIAYQTPVHIAQNAVIGNSAQLGAYSSIGPGCVLGDGVRIGDFTQLSANVTVGLEVSIGARCRIHPGVVLAADGFGFARDQGRWVKVPHHGGVYIGDDVEIGANTTIDRGEFGDTIIEEGVKLDNQIQIGHNVRVGAHTAIAACSGVAGGAQVGKRCTIAGGVGIVGGIQIVDDVTVTGMSLVSKSIHKPGTYSSGWPAKEQHTWRRRVAYFHRLSALFSKTNR